MKQISSLFVAGILLLSLCACTQSAEERWQEQYDLGVRYLSEGNYEEAIIAFTAAIEIDPKRAEGYIGRGNTYVLSGETEDNLTAALSDYETALELDETLTDAWLGLADIYIRQGNYEKALEVLRTALDNTGNNQDIADKITEMEKGRFTDSSGNMRRLNCYDDTGALVYYHTYTYDEQGREASVTSYNEVGTQTGHVENKYDRDGNILYGTDGYLLDSGYLRPAEYIRDADGELLEKIVYQPDGTVKEQVRYEWNQNRTREETKYYDGMGVLQESSVTQYDGNGYPIEISWFDASGKKSQTGIYEYDEAYHLISIFWYDSENALPSEWVYHYDEQGNKIGMDEYDHEGNLRRSTVYE